MRSKIASTPRSRTEERFASIIRWVVAALCALAPSHAHAAANGAPDTNEFVLQLTVLEAAHNRPLAGVSVIGPDSNPARDLTRAAERTFVTDAAGTAAVRIPAQTISSSWLFLRVQHSNYAARALLWQAAGTSVRDLIPTNYTMRLAAGLDVGGFVRDELGRPVNGAEVLVWGSDVQAEQRAFTPGQAREYSYVLRAEPSGIHTDTNGFWVRHAFPADADQVWVEVIRPDGARAQFASLARSQNYGGPRVADVDLKELQAARAVLSLKEGITISGIVVDQAGRPLAGARVRERSPQAFPSALPFGATTGADGRFELRHRTGPRLLLGIEADGYAIRSVPLALASRAVETRVVLSQAQPARLRVLGEQDAPVADAQVQPIEWRNPSQLLDWQARTDAAGRVVWTNAPRDPVVVMVTASNYSGRAVKLLPGQAETVTHLRRDMDQAFTVRVKVVDDKSGQPIPGCDVLRSFQYPPGFTNWGQAGQDGIFQSELDVKKLRPGFASAYSLMVTAEGYGAWTGELHYFDEGDQDLLVSLSKARPPAGIVLRPDGQPAMDAKVILNTTETGIYSYRPGEFQSSGQGYEVRQTGADGSFRFKAAGREHHLLITHASGFAALTVGALPENGKVPLQPWGGVGGVLRYGGQPVANENVSIKYPVNWAGLESHHLVYTVTTDAQGRFTFTNLPAGDYVLYRMPRFFSGRPTTESHRYVTTVKAGATTKIDYTFGGRTVQGHVEADDAVDWKNDPQVLEAKVGEPPPEPIYFGYTDPVQFRKARKAYADSPETLQWERKRQQYLLLFDSDGSFHADDVVPGTYELRLRVTKPPAKGAARGWYGNEEELGVLNQTVIVPPGAAGTEADLGNFEMTLKVPGVPHGGPLALQAITLAGRPFDVADLRGQPVVLLFWANWAPNSVARLAELREAAANLGPNRHAAFLTVNLDEEVAAAQRRVQDLDRGWTHTRLEGPGRFEVAERLEVDTLPLTLLLNAEGVVAARDVSGKRLPALLDRLAKNPPKKSSRP